MQIRRRFKSAILSKRCVGVILVATIYGCVLVQARPSQQEANPPRPMTVCEIFKNPSAYRGKVVTVKGIYWYGLRQSCAEPFVTGKHTWPTVIDMVHSDIRGAAGEEAPFTTDNQSWDRLQLFVRQEARAGRREEIWVTVVGMLRAPESYVKRDGTVVGGYGRLSLCPAQLVMKTVLGISIIIIGSPGFPLIPPFVPGSTFPAPLLWSQSPTMTCVLKGGTSRAPERDSTTSLTNSYMQLTQVSSLT